MRAELPWAADAGPEEAEPAEGTGLEGLQLGLSVPSVERVASQILSQPKSEGHFSDASGDLKTQIKKFFQSHTFSLKHFNRLNLKENIFRNWYEESNS